MALFGCADVVVVRNSHPLPELAKFARDLVRVLLRSLARSLRRPLDLLPVLVGARQKEGVGAKQPLPPRDRIASNGRVCMANMRSRIHVINRSRDVELPAHRCFLAS